MSWTEERIEMLRKLWEQGTTASVIAETLGGVSRNAVIGKAHRLGLQARPSPVKTAEAKAEAKDAAREAPAAAAPPPPVAAPKAPAPSAPPSPARAAAPPAAPAQPAAPAPRAPMPAPIDAEAFSRAAAPTGSAPAARPGPPAHNPITATGAPLYNPDSPMPPAPPRRLVPAKPSADVAGKTSLLDLSDRICRWPIGHPGEPDFHFCGAPVNPGFPYCTSHCAVAYQAQLPRRDRRPGMPPPFGGPRLR